MQPITMTLGVKDSIEFLFKDFRYPKDISIEDRIRFFSFRNFGSLGEDKEFYSFLLLENKVIGIAHVGYYSLSVDNERTWSISFLSIDKDFRSLGYSKLLVDAVFKEAKTRGLDISTSSYTVLGKEYLQKQFNEYAEKYGVKFYDKPEEWGLIDAEWMYKIVDGKKLHKDECNGWD